MTLVTRSMIVTLSLRLQQPDLLCRGADTISPTLLKGKNRIQRFGRAKFPKQEDSFLWRSRLGKRETSWAQRGTSWAQRGGAPWLFKAESARFRADGLGLRTPGDDWFVWVHVLLLGGL